MATYSVQIDTRFKRYNLYGFPTREDAAEALIAYLKSYSEKDAITETRILKDEDDSND